MPYQTKIGLLELISKEANSQVSLYKADPTPLEEKNLGQLFILTEIESADAKFEQVISLIQEELRYNYYNATDFEPEIALENALTSLNHKLQRIIGELGESWLQHFNIVIAVLKDLSLYLTHLGTSQAFLVQGNQIINIIANTSPRLQKINPLKIFSSIISGNVAPKSIVILSSESLLNYFSLEKIKKTVLDYEPDKAAQYFVALLAENNPQSNFAAFIIKQELITEPATEGDFTHHRLPQAADSMQELVQKERATGELLTPRLWPKIRKPRFTAPGGILPKILVILKNIALQIISVFGFLLQALWQIIHGRKEYKHKVRTLPHRATSTVARSINWFKNLNRPRQILLILAVILLFFFAQSIVRKGINQETKENLAQYEETMVQVEKKINDAKAQLLMKNEKGARENLIEAKGLLASVPATSKIYKEKGENFSKTINENLDKVNHLQKIDTPTLLYDFGTDLNYLTFFGANLYGLAQDGSVYSTQGKILGVSDTVQGLTKDSAATALVYFGGKNFMQFNPVLQKYSDVTVSFANQDMKIKEIVFFANRLYVLDTKNNQIFKHLKDGDNYAEGTSWLTDKNVDLRDARSMAIDGSIFVLKENGEVIKLYGGSKAEFKLASPDPALSAATKIFTNETTTYLYLLDPNNKRVAVFNKEDGNLVDQYFSESFDNLKDFFADEANKKLYVLNSGKVYSIDI